MPDTIESLKAKLKSLIGDPTCERPFGFSFADNDEHVIRLVEKSRVSQVIVGIYGDPQSDANRRIISRAQLMADRRAQIRRRSAATLNVHFFDAQSAQVWG